VMLAVRQGERAPTSSRRRDR